METDLFDIAMEALIALHAEIASIERMGLRLNIDDKRDGWAIVVKASEIGELIGGNPDRQSAKVKPPRPGSCLEPFYTRRQEGGGSWI